MPTCWHDGKGQEGVKGERIGYAVMHCSYLCALGSGLLH
jgi:hypothetical protein